MNRNNNNEEEVVMTAGSCFHDHMSHCEQCRSNVMSSDCQEGNRALRQSVREGTPYESDRQLDRLRNGPQDDFLDD